MATLTPAPRGGTVRPAMFQTFQSWFILCVLWTAAPGWASEAIGQSARGVLVLRNGQVLTGTMTRVGDRYVVANSDGSELRIPTREVEMHCLDLDEAYLRRRQTVGARDVSAHLQLADWCLRCGLNARAADELLVAMSLAPRDPRIAGLERRLQTAVHPQTAQPAAPAPAPPPLPKDDMERVMASLPSDAVEGFASRIQPLLLNRCGSNGCHGGRSGTAFQLLSPGWGKTITLRYTQRNLLAAYQQVNAAEPETSPLLTAPKGPHGGMKSGVFGERDQAQWDLLNAWVKRTSTAKSSAQPTAVAGPAARATPSSLRQAAAGANPSDASANSPTGLRVRPASLEVGEADSATVDFRDPFDPERFNRQFQVPPAAPAPRVPANTPETPDCSTTTAAVPATRPR